MLTASRVGRKPIVIPAGVSVDIKDHSILIKGPKGSLNVALHSTVNVVMNDGKVEVKQISDTSDIKTSKTEKKVRKNVRKSTSERKVANSIPGTIRAEINNAVRGVSTGFERKLILVGVGYRAQMKGKVLSLAIGYSHPVEFTAPEGVTIRTPSQTEIIIEGASKHLVGHTASKIVDIRPQEPYKGKGVVDPLKPVVRKETKKK